MGQSRFNVPCVAELTFEVEASSADAAKATITSWLKDRDMAVTTDGNGRARIWPGLQNYPDDFPVVVPVDGEDAAATKSADAS